MKIYISQYLDSNSILVHAILILCGLEYHAQMYTHLIFSFCYNQDLGGLNPRSWGHFTHMAKGRKRI